MLIELAADLLLGSWVVGKVDMLASLGRTNPWRVWQALMLTLKRLQVFGAFFALRVIRVNHPWPVVPVGCAACDADVCIGPLIPPDFNLV